MKHLILKSVLFSALLAVILLSVDHLFLKNQSRHVTSLRTIYETDKKPIDVLVMGNSHVFKAIHSEIIDAKCDLNSIVVFGGGLNIVQIYFNLREALKYHDPEIVVLETWAFYTPSPGANEHFNKGFLRHNKYGDEYSKEFSLDKVEEISLTHEDNTLYHTFNFFRFHERWIDNETWAKSLHANFKYSVDQRVINEQKHINQLTVEKLKEFEEINIKTNEIRFSEDEKTYLLKISKLLESNNAELLLLNVPVLDMYYNRTKEASDCVSDDIMTFIEGQKNVNFYDMNRLLGGLDRTLIVNERKVTTNQHVNYQGAVLTSNLLADYINTNYSINGSSTNQIDTPETYLYNLKPFKNSPNFSAGVTEIAGVKVKDSIPVITRKLGSSLTIKGWMNPYGETNEGATKIVGLKDDDGLVYVFRKQIHPRKSYKGELYKAYTFKMNSNLIQPGIYTVSNFLLFDNGTLLKKDSLAQFKLEAVE